MSDFAICRNCEPGAPGWRLVFESGNWRLFVTDGPGYSLQTLQDATSCAVILGMTRDLPATFAWGKRGRMPDELSAAIGGTACGAALDASGFSAFRDKTGLIPIVEFEGKNGIRAVTTSPSFLTELTADAPIRASWMANYLAVWNTDSREDVMEGVTRLRAGELVQWRGERKSHREYWPKPSFYEPIDVRSTEEAGEVLRSAFVSAVSRIPRDRPATYTMSGGLDSCGIIGVALHHGFEPESPLHAVSLISGRHPESDESQEIGVMERHFGLCVERVDMDDASVDVGEPTHDQLQIRDSYHFDAFGPVSAFGNASPLLMHNRTAQTRPGSRLITGIGGNYLVVVANEAPWIDLIRRRDVSGFVDELRHLNAGDVNQIIHRFAANLFHGHLRTGLRRCLPSALSRHLFAPVHPVEFLGEIRNREFLAEHPIVRWEYDFLASPSTYRLFLLRSWNRELSARAFDRYIRLSGVENYDPLFDPELYETCARLPMRAHQSHNSYRPAYKEALSPFLPEAILHHPKNKTFNAVNEAWLLSSERTWLERAIEGARSTRMSAFIDVSQLQLAFAKLSELIRAGAPMHSRTYDAVWRAISICL